MNRLKCVFGRHQRSKAHAVAEKDSAYRSICMHCGVPMRQDHRRKWMVDRRRVDRVAAP